MEALAPGNVQVQSDVRLMSCMPVVRNYLEPLCCLKNRYVLMRHPRSEPNRTGMLLTNPRRALHDGDLDEGAEQDLLKTLQWAVEANAVPLRPIVVTSPFLRTRRAAAIAARFLDAAPPTLCPALRERNFGTFDGREYDQIYPLIQALDRQNPFHRHGGVESVASVAARTTWKIFNLELRFSGKTFLLMSHHETCQVLLRCFAKGDVASYADVGLIPNCAVMPLNFDERDTSVRRRPLTADRKCEDAVHLPKNSK